MFRDSVVTLFETLYRRRLYGLRKTTMTLMQDTGCPVRRLGPIPSHTNQQCQQLNRSVRSEYKRDKPRRQDGQCAHNVTLARSSNSCCSGKAKSITCLFWMCVCNLSYPACNAQAPYNHLQLVLVPKRHHFRGERERKEKEKEKSYWTYSWNECFDFLYNSCLKHSSFWEAMIQRWNTSRLVKYPSFL
jgi:hypothetical protein